LYYPLVAFIPAFFDRHRGAAMGFVLAGSGVGGLVMAPVLHVLLTRVGVRWSLRIFGLWNLLVCVPVAYAVRRPPGYRNATRVSLNLAKQGTFLFQVSTTRNRLQCRSLCVLSLWVHFFRLPEMSYPCISLQRIQHPCFLIPRAQRVCYLHYTAP